MEGAEISFREVVEDKARIVGWGQNLGALKYQSSDSILQHWGALKSVLILKQDDLKKMVILKDKPDTKEGQGTAVEPDRLVRK